jgi:carbonic anhydrase/acetyltransferase-like protein (isoleucine patch superfamily)
MDRINVQVNKKQLHHGLNIKLVRNVIIDEDCTIGNNCNISNCYIGGKCVLGANVTLKNCIIFPNSHIGDNCVLNAVLIGNSVRIGNDCQICENTLISNECHFKDGTQLSEPAIYHKTVINNEMGSNTSLKSDVDDIKTEPKSSSVQEKATNLNNLSVINNNYGLYNVPTQLNMSDNEEEDEDDDDAFTSDDESETVQGRVENDFASIGEFSLVTGDNESDYDNDAINRDGGNSNNNNEHHFFVWRFKKKDLQQQLKKKAMSSNRLVAIQNDSDYEHDSSDYDSDDSDETVTSDSCEDEDDNDDDTGDEDEDASCMSDNDDTNDINLKNKKKKFSHHRRLSTRSHDEDVDIFYKEVLSILIRGLKQNLNNDNLILEINSCKHAYNINLEDMCYFLSKALFKLPLYNTNQKQPEFNYLNTIKSYIDNLQSLLENYFKTSESQSALLDSLLHFCVDAKLSKKNPNYEIVNFVDSYYVKMIHHMYNECDILTETNIIEWYSKQVANSELPSKKSEAIEKLKPFIKWLEEAEEEEDEDED